MVLFQSIQIFAAEHFCNGFFMDDKAFVPGFTQVLCAVKSASGNGQMEVGMEIQLLSPCVKNRNNAASSPHVLFFPA